MDPARFLHHTWDCWTRCRVFHYRVSSRTASNWQHSWPRRAGNTASKTSAEICSRDKQQRRSILTEPPGILTHNWVENKVYQSREVIAPQFPVQWQQWRRQLTVGLLWSPMQFENVHSHFPLDFDYIRLDYVPVKTYTRKMKDFELSLKQKTTYVLLSQPSANFGEEKSQEKTIALHQLRSRTNVRVA